MLNNPLSYPNNKNLTYQSLSSNNEQFCDFLATLNYKEIEVRYRKLFIQYELKKDYQNDLLKIKKELENKKFFATSNAEALLHLMTISKILSKMTLELIPEGKFISTVQNYLFDLIDALFGTKNTDPNDFEMPSHIKEQYTELLGKYQPLYTVGENMNQLIQDTIKNESEMKIFINDYRNLLNNLESKIKEYSSKFQIIQNDMESIKLLKESIDKFKAKNCPQNLEIKLASLY